MTHENSFYGPLADPAADAGYLEHPPRVGFFTDTSVCIGCKACEVACKEWNAVPEDGLNLLGMSFDNTSMLGADPWRHVAFIEQDRPLGAHDAGLAGLPTGPGVSEATAEVVAEAMREAPRGGGDLGTAPVDLGFPSFQLPGAAPGEHDRTDFRWLTSSDVCKHCTHAGCLDVCPTGALFRTEFGTVVVQEDICNGCGYCVSGCPYGVIDRRHGDGRASKCTLCYDRLRGGLETGLRQGLPDQIHPVRSAGRTAGTRGPATGPAARRGRYRGQAVRPRSGRRCWRQRGVLPAAGRTRGVRPAARSNGAHP